MGTSQERHGWRLQTNFVEPKDIMSCFGSWPDDVLSPNYLEALYSGTVTDEESPFTVRIGQGIQPAFPFLDASEGARIAAIWETLKGKVYPYVRDILSGFSSPSENSCGQSPVGCILLILQALGILELRNREEELGLWDRRTESQKVGTLYALRPYEATFTRVEAIPFAENDIICVPWGGPFNEYSKILELLENPHTAQVLASADEKMEVVPDAFVIRQMVGAGLVRETRKGLVDSIWHLTVPIVNGREMRETLLAISPAVRDLSYAVQDALPELINLAESGRYSYLAGVGDFIEMSYSVLLGLVLQWVVQDGFLGRPPQYRVVQSDRGIHDVSIAGKRRGVPVTLTGIAIVKSAYAMWDDLLAVTDPSSNNPSGRVAGGMVPGAGVEPARALRPKGF